jgi:hypothetical protein
MKAPIARRRTTGVRGMPRRRSRRRARLPLRRPLALLYRQSGEARSAAPAAVRAADGRPVQIAPRLQIALHLSFAFNAQRFDFAARTAPGGAAPDLPAAAAMPMERRERPSSTSERLILAACLRRLEPACRSLGDARIGSQRPVPQSGPRARAAPAGGHQDLVHRRLIDLRLAMPGGADRGQAPSDPAAPAVAAPPWPLREEAAPWASYIRAPLSDRGNDLSISRPGRPGATAAAGASTRHASADAVAYRTPSGAARLSPGGRLVNRERLASAKPTRPGSAAPPTAGAKAAAPPERMLRGSGTPVAPFVHLRPPSGTAVERLTRERHGILPGTYLSQSRKTGSPAARTGAAGRIPQRRGLASAQSAAPPVPSAPADRAGPAAPAGRPPRGSGAPFTRLARPRRPAGAGIDRLVRERRAAPPGASAPFFSPGVPPAALGAATALYLAERATGGTPPPEPFSGVWAPPPLDFRSAEPPPAPSPPEEVPPATTTAPSAAPIDLGAVSRDVISRIEKRLRVERERRGRS